jgi:hypothetical protein
VASSAREPSRLFARCNTCETVTQVFSEFQCQCVQPRAIDCVARQAGVSGQRSRASSTTGQASRGRAAGGHRARRARVRAPGEAQDTQRGPGRTRRARTENPIFPMFAQIIEARWPHGYACPMYADARRCNRGRIRRNAARPRGVGDHLSLTARRHHDRAERQKLTARLRLCWSTATCRASGTVRVKRRPGSGEIAVSHLASLGHRRIGLISGPRRFLPAQQLAGWRGDAAAVQRV